MTRPTWPAQSCPKRQMPETGTTADRVRLVIISYTFPPWQTSAGSSIRTAKLLKYMARARPQWRFDVLTAGYAGREREVGRGGAYMLADLARSCEIIRIDDPSFAFGSGRMRRRMSLGRITVKTARAVALRSPRLFLGLRRARFWAESIYIRAGRQSSHSTELHDVIAPLKVPDQMVDWSRAVGSWLTKKCSSGQDYDVVIATIPPVSVSLLISLLRQCSNAWLILDIRDDWAEYWPGSDPKRVALEQGMERDAVLASDAVTVATPLLRESLFSRHPNAPKITVIRNGVDLEELSTVAETKLPDVFAISCMGSLRHRDPTMFFEAFGRFSKDRDVDAESCRLYFPAQMDTAHWAHAFAHGLGRWLRPIPTFELDGYRRQLVNSSVLLVLQIPGRQSAIPGKLYEYAVSGRPVLHLENDGEGPRFVIEHELGEVVDPDDVSAIHAAIRRLYFRWDVNRNALPIDPRLEAFSRQRQASQMIDVIEDLQSHGRAPRACERCGTE